MSSIGNDQLGIGYSVKEFLEENTGIESLLHFDGAVLPEEKPFIVVKQRSTTNTVISKMRESINLTYRYEVGLFERSLADRTKSQSKIRDLFLFEKMPLYDREGNRTGRSVWVDIENETTLDAEDISDETKTHRMYFDIEVKGTYHRNRGNK